MFGKNRWHFDRRKATQKTIPSCIGNKRSQHVRAKGRAWLSLADLREGTLKRRTIIVEGPLAFHMRRAEAARRGEAGVQILTLPLLAARLAGGFTRPARSPDLFPPIRSALEQGGFIELGGVRQLPGTTRAVARSLGRIWESDLSLRELAAGSHRLHDLAAIEGRVRAALPVGVLTPRDLRNAALERAAHVPAVLGSVELYRVFWVAPVWRPRISTTCAVVFASATGTGAGFRHSRFVLGVSSSCFFIVSCGLVEGSCYPSRSGCIRSSSPPPQSAGST